MRETNRGIPRNDRRISAGTRSSHRALPSSTKSWISPSRRGAWCSAVGRVGEFERREIKEGEGEEVWWVGTRDGSARFGVRDPRVEQK